MRYGKALVLCGGLILLFALSGCAGTSETSGGSLEIQLNELLADSYSALNGVTSADQAAGAQDVLKDMDAELANIVKESESASPDVQFNLTKIAREALPKFQELAIKAIEIPGVAEKLGPTVKSMTEHLTALL